MRLGQASALRVVHVGPCLMRGGAEFWLAALARFLDPRVVRIVRCIVTLADQIDPEVAAELGGIPIEVGGAEAVRRAVAEADVLLSWGTPQLGRWLADCRPRLSVFVAHGEGAWTRDIFAACRPVVDHVVAVSERVREKVCDGLPCTTILNGIDSSRLAVTRSRREVRETLGFAPDDFILGFVGRFAQEKRVHVILDALAGLPAHFKALLVGSGPLRSSLLEMANERLPGRYAFVKAARYLGDYYQAMDSTCLISHEEGFALVMLEAMMCGRPLIATPVGAVPEVVVDRVNGLIIPGTAESLRQAAQLLERHPDWARGLAAEGRSFAIENGHARQMAARYEALLHRLWAERQGTAPFPPSQHNGHAPVPSSANGFSALGMGRANSRPHSRRS
jgi:glycosyltransferase involved in cell wall biosynthesis